MDDIVLEKAVINYFVYVKKLSISEATQLYNNNYYYFSKVLECIGDDLLEFLLLKIPKDTKSKTMRRKK